MKIAFVMDPLSKVNPSKDTTYYIMLAASERGHQVFFLNQYDLWYEDGKLMGVLTQVKVHADIAQPFSVEKPKNTALDHMDVIFVRTDPPFDRNYFYTTLLLDLLPATTKVLNRPSGLRNWNEKLAAELYPEYTPTTLVTQRSELIQKFAATRKRITIKPIDGYAGKGIFFLEPGDANFDQVVDLMTNGQRRRVLVQEYVPAATEGDKRILLLNGEPMGAILRLHPEGKELNNLDAGGTAHPTELNDRDLKICAAMKEGLVQEGIFFAGIDIIGGMLIEINVTSPTGLQQLCTFSGIPFHHHIIEAMEKGGFVH